MNEQSFGFASTSKCKMSLQLYEKWDNFLPYKTLFITSEMVLSRPQKDTVMGLVERINTGSCVKQFIALRRPPRITTYTLRSQDAAKCKNVSTLFMH